MNTEMALCPCGCMESRDPAAKTLRARKSPSSSSVIKTYADCCGRYLNGGETAPTAEALGKRYTAYTMGREDYLLATWSQGTRPVLFALAAEPSRKWLGLEVKRHEQSQPDEALVEFVARYKVGGRACRLHETSRFAREGGRWFYVDGEMI